MLLSVKRSEQLNIGTKLVGAINPFVPNVPFFYPLKTSENRKVFRYIQGVEKGCIGNKRVKYLLQNNFLKA